MNVHQTWCLPLLTCLSSPTAQQQLPVSSECLAVTEDCDVAQVTKTNFPKTKHLCLKCSHADDVTLNSHPWTRFQTLFELTSWSGSETYSLRSLQTFSWYDSFSESRTRMHGLQWTKKKHFVLDKDRTTWQNRFIWRWLTSLPPCPCDSPAEGTPAETNTDTWTSYHTENKHKTPAECWEVWRHMYRWLLWSRGRFSCSSLWSTWDTRRKHPEISALQYKTSRKEIIQKENGLQIFSLLKFLYRQR